MFEGTLQGIQTHIGEAQFGLKSINTLYIRVINFFGTTDDDFKAALENLVKTSPLKGIKRAVEGVTLQKEL